MLSAILFVLIGCQDKDLSKTAVIAKDYLEEQNYKVLSYTGKEIFSHNGYQENFKITEDNINNSRWKFSHSVADGNPEQYIGKVIDIESFIIKNHPLDHWKSHSGLKSKGKTYVFVFVVEGKVVGGTSFPFMPKGYDEDGGYWPIDGRAN